MYAILFYLKSLCMFVYAFVIIFGKHLYLHLSIFFYCVHFNYFFCKHFYLFLHANIVYFLRIVDLGGSKNMFPYLISLCVLHPKLHRTKASSGASNAMVNYNKFKYYINILYIKMFLCMIFDSRAQISVDLIALSFIFIIYHSRWSFIIVL